MQLDDIIVISAKNIQRLSRFPSFYSISNYTINQRLLQPHCCYKKPRTNTDALFSQIWEVASYFFSGKLVASLHFRTKWLDLETSRDLSGWLMAQNKHPYLLPALTKEGFFIRRSQCNRVCRNFVFCKIIKFAVWGNFLAYFGKSFMLHTWLLFNAVNGQILNNNFATCTLSKTGISRTV